MRGPRYGPPCSMQQGIRLPQPDTRTHRHRSLHLQSSSLSSLASLASLIPPVPPVPLVAPPLPTLLLYFKSREPPRLISLLSVASPGISSNCWCHAPATAPFPCRSLRHVCISSGPGLLYANFSVLSHALSLSLASGIQPDSGIPVPTNLHPTRRQNAHHVFDAD